MSDESYRILNDEEVNKYIDCPWFKKECKFISNCGWAVPEKYLLKDLDRKSFYRSKLSELLEEFDFEKVHKIMELLDWRWVGVIGIPERTDMIPVVKSLYDSIEGAVLRSERSSATTGGFMLTFDPDDEFKLAFEAVTYSVYDD
jgi:hypothetical protein